MLERAGLPLLEVRDLTKEFPGTRALDAVHFEVRYGEIHALLGENGAGKSTLIKIVAGAYAPTAGSVLVDGKPVRFESPADALAAGISVVHQHSNLVPFLSVEENLWLGRPLPRWAGLFVDWRRVRKRARDVLDYVGLHIEPSAIVAELRPDERAMISIAKAVASDARLIVLDEPTAALLPGEVDTLFAQMRRLAREGHGFVYVSHRLSEVMAVADRATVLRDGRNAGTFECAGLDRRVVVGAIVGPAKTMRDPEAALASDGPVALDVTGLSGSASRVKAVSFTARRGEILGLAGLPGSGAEETIDLLFGRTSRTAGTIVLDGRTLELRDERSAVAAGIALVPKERLAEALFPGQSVRENVTIVGLGKFRRDRVFGFIDRGAERTAAARSVTELNVKTAGLERPIESLSGGNQQKVAIARWLETGATLFLLNSPTAAIDIGAKAEIYELVRLLAGRGATILFTSTEVEEYARLCPRVLVFHDGAIAGELTGSGVDEANILHLAMGAA